MVQVPGVHVEVPQRWQPCRTKQLSLARLLTRPGGAELMHMVFAEARSSLGADARADVGGISCLPSMTAMQGHCIPPDQHTSDHAMWSHSSRSVLPL